MVLQSRVRTCLRGALIFPLLIAGCAAPSAATTANTEKSLWQRMAWWQPSAPPTMGPSTKPSDENVRLAEGGGPKKIKDPARLNLAYGRWQEQIGQLSEARKAYDNVLQEEPKSVDAILGLARLDLLAGRTREAEAGFQRAVQLKPSDTHALAGLGQFYASQERWPEAIQTLESALSQAKSDVNVTQPDKVKIEYNLALAKARSGDIPGAMPHFANSVGEAEGRYNVGHLLYEKGDKIAAAQQFEQALRLRPDLHEAQALLEEIRQTSAGTQLTSGVRSPTAGVQNAAAARATNPQMRSVAAPGIARPSPVARQLPAGPIPSATASPAGGTSPNATPSQPTANMTPQQREQWENQFGQTATRQ